MSCKVPGRLVNYSAYAEAYDSHRRFARHLADFNDKANHDPELRRLKSIARNELQELYDQIAARFRLPSMTVYMPKRKKIAIRGCLLNPGTPLNEIRVYPIVGPNKPYDQWRPVDVRTSPEYDVLDTLIHESAHALEVVRFGKGGHGATFRQAYDEIAAFVIDLGYGELVGRIQRPVGADVDPFVLVGLVLLLVVATVLSLFLLM